jgi:phenylpropionate dioxygenase-like ring-hydroxylating dioxygenase large terminal subunit
MHSPGALDDACGETFMTNLLDDRSVVQRVLDHVDRQTTDLGDEVWREPVGNYFSKERFAAEVEILRRRPVAFCPSAALPDKGSYVAHNSAGASIIAVRGADGVVTAFRNACRHRGMPLAEKSGCQKAFVCRYHGWTYGLDGSLIHIPDEYGFPGLDKSTRGLVPLPTREHGGLVFVTQSDIASGAADPENLPPLPLARHKLRRAWETETNVNWKIVAEGFLEGYHIRHLHRDTFYPAQFDNLNVIESFGRNSRVVFPYRAINKMRETPPSARTAQGVLTYVYHLFPNVMVVTFPATVSILILEPLEVDRTLLISYVVTDRETELPEVQAKVQDREDFSALGAVEDTEATQAIQRSLNSGANEFFEFGRFEKAICHFHRSLSEALKEIGFVDSSQ